MHENGTLKAGKAKEVGSNKTKCLDIVLSLLICRFCLNGRRGNLEECALVARLSYAKLEIISLNTLHNFRLEKREIFSLIWKNLAICVEVSNVINRFLNVEYFLCESIRR